MWTVLFVFNESRSQNLPTGVVVQFSVASGFAISFNRVYNPVHVCH
jgi:hypothetical protein